MDALFGGGVAGGGAGASAGGHSFPSGSGLAPAGSGAVYSSSSEQQQQQQQQQQQFVGLEAAASILVNPAHFNGHDNGPILYTDPNRTSAIDDIRSIVIYIFIITIFLCFFLILPGIRNEKLPTFFCITTSLLVGSIIVLSLFGTSWHVGEAPISSAYKAFSRDRIQGELNVRMGLQSVNISLKAHKYYILHHADGPVIMENMPPTTLLASMTASVTKSAPVSAATGAGAGVGASASERSKDHAISDQSASSAAASFIHADGQPPAAEEPNLGDELLSGRTSDGIPLDTELETDEVFSVSESEQDTQKAPTRRRSAPTRHKRQHEHSTEFQNQTAPAANSANIVPKYTIKRVHVDINYNERFYWIGPVQMRHEYQQALERGLPYPILTVVEYLSQDDAGFNWSRRYRAAGYYTSMCLWLSASLCILMFCLHCAAPKYGIYTMQLIGCLLLFTNLTYAMLVPRGDHKLVIPFEGQSLMFRFGWNFWLVLIGGCLSLLVGTIIVILDNLFPNFIFTTVLDADFDAPQSYYQRKHKMILHSERSADSSATNSLNRRQDAKPKLPAFIQRKMLERHSRSSNEASLDNSKLKLSEMHSEAHGKQPPEDGDGHKDSVESGGWQKKSTRSESISKQKSGEVLRKRSENQIASQTVTPSLKAIDHRDIDSREGADPLQTIRL